MSFLRNIINTIWPNERWPIVDVETWLDDPYFMGNIGRLQEGWAGEKVLFHV